MTVLEAVVMAAPYIKQAIKEDVEIVVTDREKFLLYLPSGKMDAGLKPGDPIPPDDESLRGALAGKRTDVKVPAEVYGAPFMASAFPVWDERGNVAGAIGIGYSLEKDVLLETYMADMQEISRQLKENIHTIAAHAEELSATSEAVAQHSQLAAQSAAKSNEVLHFIRNVSKQTNLLGLNASIEAARAGTYGAGFQVVAQEVRKLSRETANATNQIEASLSEMKAAMETLADDMLQMNASSREQAELTVQLMATIERLEETSRSMKVFIGTLLRI